MADERPVYGLSLSHLFTMRWQDVSIHQLAEQQARLIRERQRQGPLSSPGLVERRGPCLGGGATAGAGRGLGRVSSGLLDTQPDQAVYAAGDATPGRGVDDLYTAGPEGRLRVDPSARTTGAPAASGVTGGRQPPRSTPSNGRGNETFFPMRKLRPRSALWKLGYALAREAARFVTVTRFNPIQAPIHVWWTTSTLAKHVRALVDWSAHTTGLVSVDTVVGDHVDAGLKHPRTPADRGQARRHLRAVGITNTDGSVSKRVSCRSCGH